MSAEGIPFFVLPGMAWFWWTASCPGTYDGLQAQINRFSKQRVLVLINTDSLPWNTGNNARFRQAGTGVPAHQNLVSQAGSKAAPAKTFDREFDMHLG